MFVIVANELLFTTNAKGSTATWPAPESLGRKSDERKGGTAASGQTSDSARFGAMLVCAVGLVFPSPLMVGTPFPFFKSAKPAAEPDQLILMLTDKLVLSPATPVMLPKNVLFSPVVALEACDTVIGLV